MQQERQSIMKTWFLSDPHLFHKNILHFSPVRQKMFNIRCEQDIETGIWKYWDTLVGDIEISEERAISLMNERFIALYNEKVAKKDTVYILGDFSFGGLEETMKCFHKMNGHKNIIYGNHDATARKIVCWQSASDIKFLNFKKNVYSFLDENFLVSLCHYPIVSWERKIHGAVMLHGHCHNHIDEYNKQSKELRLDVGIDGPKFIWSLEDVYEYMKSIAGDKTFAQYNEDFKYITL